MTAIAFTRGDDTRFRPEADLVIISSLIDSVRNVIKGRRHTARRRRNQINAYGFGHLAMAAVRPTV